MNAPLAHHPPSLCLAAHVRVCTVDDQIILMDLRRSRYLSIAGTAAQALGAHLQGWPGSPRPSPDRPETGAVPAATCSALIERLRTDGLVTAGQGPAHPQPLIEEPTASLGVAADAPSPPGVGQVFRFFRAGTASALSLRLRSLESITAAVSAAHARVRGLGATPADSFRLAAAYERLRPLALTAEDRCLHDSLALMNFLAAERASAHWVIGVKIRPFGAHS
jgi:hypothetical protein